MFMRLATAALALTAFAATSAQAARGDWDTIGYTTVNGSADRDTITVRGNDRHRQVRICAVNRPFALLDADFHFNNGGHQDVPARSALRAGTCTNAIDLKGKRRNLTRVSLRYSKIRRGFLPPLVRVQAR